MSQSGVSVGRKEKSPCESVWIVTQPSHSNSPYQQQVLYDPSASNPNPISFHSYASGHTYDDEIDKDQTWSVGYGDNVRYGDGVEYRGGVQGHRDPLFSDNGTWWQDGGPSSSDQPVTDTSFYPLLTHSSNQQPFPQQSQMIPFDVSRIQCPCPRCTISYSLLLELPHATHFLFYLFLPFIVYHSYFH